MKEKFYIFLDVDGTLFDINYQHSVYADYKKKYGMDFFTDLKTGQFELECIDPKCIKALNYLIDNLENHFDTQLVISSDVRKHMPPLIAKLKEKGLRYKKKIDNTPKIQNNKRGREILSYLEGKPNPDNIVVIDDGKYDLYECFTPEKIIHLEHGTRIDNKEYSLNKGHVDTFLKTINPRTTSKNDKTK